MVLMMTSLTDYYLEVQCRQKLSSFAAYDEQHVDYTTSRNDLGNCMMFKVVKQVNNIGVMESFTKPNLNLRIEEHLKIPKNLRERIATMMNKIYQICGAFQNKNSFHQSFLSTDDPITG